MGRQDFEAILDKHDQVKGDRAIAWAERKQVWLQFIDEFYACIEQWLAPYCARGKVAYEYNDLSLSEEYIGRYDVKALSLSFAEQLVSIRPIGTTIIGASGRIDMEGARGIVQFVLVDAASAEIKTNTKLAEGKSKNAEACHTRNMTNRVWKIVIRGASNIAFDDFTADNFFSALTEIIHG